MHKMDVRGKKSISYVATLDEKLTSCGIAQTLCAIYIEGNKRGEEGKTLVTTACPEAGR